MARKPRHGGRIPTPPRQGQRPSGGGGGSSSGSTQSGSGSSSGSGHSGGGGGGGGGGNDPYARMRADQRQAEQRASDKYIDQVNILRQQANALRVALGRPGQRGSFRDRLAAQLRNINQGLGISDRAMMHGYREQVGSLRNSAEDNEKAAAGQTYANTVNAGRERGQALSEATLQGAGESDMLRAQGMAIRNWNANQNEISRSFHDTKSSIDASLTGLNAETRTARIQAQLDANKDRELVWGSYYDRMSEASTTLGNTLGEMASNLSLANEQVPDKKIRRRMRRAQRQSGNAFTAASEYAGENYDARGIPKRIRRWDGVDGFSSDLGQGQINRVGSTLAKPEGATLREWQG